MESIFKIKGRCLNNGNKSIKNSQARNKRTISNKIIPMAMSIQMFFVILQGETD